MHARCSFGNPEQKKGIPSDYFEGVIERYNPNAPDEEGGEVLSNVDGSWVGFVDFDKVSNVLYCVSLDVCTVPCVFMATCAL